MHTFIEWANPIRSVAPWLLTTGLSSPKKIAPLYFLGSSFSLNFLSDVYENNFENIFSDFFKLPVIKFAVPSAVFKAMFPVKHL